jgi:hypothetical protein
MFRARWWRLAHRGPARLANQRGHLVKCTLFPTCKERPPRLCKSGRSPLTSSGTALTPSNRAKYTRNPRTVNMAFPPGARHLTCPQCETHPFLHQECARPLVYSLQMHYTLCESYFWLTGIHIHRVADGKIVELWEETNLLGLMQQLGVFPQ